MRYGAGKVLTQSATPDAVAEDRELNFGWGICRIFAHREAVSDWLTKLEFDFTSAGSTIGCRPRFLCSKPSRWGPGAEVVRTAGEKLE
ncbi:hypothetical protein AZE42_10687 [Rhizopogon vesiculosus]|uniref:Uncharacterized protein n=1 Tax=Rhizopogon vesiculosus TaxID=180088 RepID=A0A1J8PMI4_9AGAM|nr:hypothetical protein AZE42_10687 [Rhizopogon vesiculosus]